MDPSVLSPEVYVCFRTPGTPPCRSLHVKNTMSQLGHHTLTFNDVYNGVKRNFGFDQVLIHFLEESE